MSQRSVNLTLSAAVATGGTFTVGYPAGYNSGDFSGAPDHSFTIGNMGPFFNPADFTVSFGATEATVTYNGATTLPAGVAGYFTFDLAGDQANYDTAYARSIREAHTVMINLGAPTTADADGACASQGVTADEEALINGALAEDGVATFETPRNVKAAWTTSAKLTITGTDIDGNTVVEETASAGTSHTGKKAFKTVTSVVPDTTITGLTVGEGVVLGIPVWLPGAGHVLSELQDGAAATAGTLAAGLSPNTVSGATTADVRGTYSPNSAPNGARVYDLIVALPDPTNTGNPQYAG